MISSVYLHIPFCKSICSYCDFCKMLYDERNVFLYLEALKKEVLTFYRGEKLKTIYIGGGTPSCLSLPALEFLFSIVSLFSFHTDIEFTFECNIEQLTEELLEFLFVHGVNRLSIGVQTGHPKFLKFLNRFHDKEMVKKRILLAKEVGFSNINVDLMYAYPGQTLEDLKEDLEFLVQLYVPHISTYSLMISPHTKLYIDGVEPILEELDADMYDLVCSTLKQYGYIHYEVSNFGHVGYSSIHNQMYWNNEYYYGFGLGASGYAPLVRYENTRSLNHYITGKYRLEEHVVSKAEQMENEFILGFRKVSGISIHGFFEKYGIDVYDLSVVKKMMKKGFLIERDGYLFIPDRYFYLSNMILREFIGMEVFYE